MKKIIFLLLLLIVPIFLIGIASADTTKCVLTTSLLNQDPFPAIPGEYVKLVFRVDGLSDPVCGNYNFKLVENYPIIFDSGSDNIININSGGFASNFVDYALLPFKVRVDNAALDGDNEVELEYSDLGTNTIIKKRFNLTIENPNVDFEISVKDYVESTQIITFEILNVGKNNIESLVAEIPKQENIKVKGSNKEIIGSLDSNEDTTFSFEAVPNSGNILMKLRYNDQNDNRRSVEQEVYYDSDQFSNRIRDVKTTPWTMYVIILIIIAIIVFFVIRRRKKKMAKEKLLRQR